MRVLGIETSCDETSAAVVVDGVDIASNIVASQIDLFQKYGGVVPEIASRKHVEFILPTVQAALDEADCTLEDIDLVAVINRPGLIGALIVGVSSAKAISYAAGLPLVGVHHLEAHICANFLQVESQVENDSGSERPDFPVLCLIVSGGHSDIVWMTDHGEYQALARTRDDAAGEAFDKVARALGLGYPGGPIIDRLAKEGNPDAVSFPRAKIADSLDFSFSGLKSAVIRYVQSHQETPIADVAASFQQAVVDMLVNHTFAAAQMKQAKRVLLAGGVAANSSLQSQFKSRGEELGIEVSAPPPKLCTDNAAMAASAGYFAYLRGIRDDLGLDTYATEALGTRMSNSS